MPFKEIKKAQRYSENMHAIFKNIVIGKKLNREAVASIVRLALRQDLWCKLENEHRYVHFGDDYYMFIGSKVAPDSIIKKIEKMGLFVEEFRSPFWEEKGLRRACGERVGYR